MFDKRLHANGVFTFFCSIIFVQITIQVFVVDVCYCRTFIKNDFTMDSKSSKSNRVDKFPIDEFICKPTSPRASVCS